MFLGLGLGRFAFSPLVPELVATGWLDAPAAQAVAAANLVGYFIGALLAAPARRLADDRRLSIAGAAIIALSYAAMLVPLGASWFWLARFAAGMGGALLMVVSTAAAARQLGAMDRARFQPLVFLGIGLGALFAALALPWLLRFGVGASLLALAVMSAAGLAALIASSGFIRPAEVIAPGGRVGRAQWLVVLAYGCDALGFVMHTVYLPDMLRRSHGFSEGQVAAVWALFGIGACLGPVFVILLRRVLAPRDTLWAALAIKAVAVALVMLRVDPVMAGVSLFLVGMLTPGLVILTSASVSAATNVGVWAIATAVFAAGQMASGLIIAAISGQGYGTALALSVAVLILGAIFAFIAGRPKK